MPQLAVLWRQKEQFSDGVGYNWIDELKNYTAGHVSDAEMAEAEQKFPDNTPATKEAYFYRSLFASHFPSPEAAACVPGGPSIACSTAVAVQWEAAWRDAADPSGRAVASHNSASFKDKK